MTPGRRPRRPASDYASLRAFARAYLHEDAGREYGGAVPAARAFAADASALELDDLAADLSRLSEQSADWPVSRLRAFFTDTLGAAAAPASAEALRQMLDAVVDRRDRRK